MIGHSVKNKRSGLKGAVLFTVLAVIMVMFILILTTITLAGYASKKAYSNWYNNQTTYTAQSLVDEIIVSLQPGQVNDKVGGDIVGKLASVGDSVKLGVTASGSSDIPGYGNIESLTFTYVADEGTDFDIPGYIVGSANGKKIIKVTASVEMGDETSSYSRYVIGGSKNSRIDANGGGYNAISSNVGGAGSDTSPTVYGHYYAGINGKLNIDSTLGNKARLAGDIFYRLGSGKTLKIEASGPEIAFGRNDPGENFYSGLRVDGNILFAGNKTIVSQYNFEEGATLISLDNGGTVELNSDLKMDDFSNIPYIYSNGTIEMSSGNLNIQGPLNIYCNELNFSTGGGPTIDGSANIFCMGDTESKFNLTTSNLTQWAHSAIGNVNSDMKTGCFYTKGSLKLDGSKPMTINGDLCVAKNLTIGDGCVITVNGKVYVGGSINDIARVNSAAGVVKQGKGASESDFMTYLDGCGLDISFREAFKEKRDMVCSDGSTVPDVPVFQTLQNLRSKYYEGLSKEEYEQDIEITSSTAKYKSGGIDYSGETSDHWDGKTPIEGSCTLNASDISKLPSEVLINPGTADICITLSPDVKSISNKTFIVDDSAKGSAAFYIKSTDSISFQQVRMLTKTYNNLLSGVNLDLKNLSSYPLNAVDKTFVPHLYLYADENNKVQITFEHGNCLLTGDILAPSAGFSWLTNTYKIADSLQYTFFNYADVNHDNLVNEADKQLDKITRTIAKDEAISVIGSIEVSEMKNVTNDFVYLYVDDPPMNDDSELSLTGYTWNILDGYSNY